MSLILAIEPDRRQASVLASIGRKLGAELIIADHAEEALASLGSRVPDLILTSALLSPKDESALAARLRELDDAAAHVQTVTIPVLAKPGKRSSSSKGLFGMLRGDSGDNVIEGCAPNVFAEQVNDYLSRAAADKRANEEARAMGRERPQVPEPSQQAASEVVRDFQQDSVEPAASGADPWASEPVGNPITAEPDGPATVIIQSANVVIEPTIAVPPAYEHQPVVEPTPPTYTEPPPVAYAEPTPVEVYQPPAYQPLETYEPPVPTYEPAVAEPAPAYEAAPIAEPVALEPPPAPVYEAPAPTPIYEPVTQYEPIAHIDRLEQPAYEAAAQPVETFEPAPISENYSAPPVEPEAIAFQPAATEITPEEFTPPEEEESFEIELADKLDVPKPDRHVIDTAAFDASKFEAEMQAALAEFEAALAAAEHAPDPVEAPIEEPALLDEPSPVYVDELPAPAPALFGAIAAPTDEASAPPVELAPPPPPEVRHETPHKTLGQRLKGLFTQSHAAEHTSIAPPREPEVIAPPAPPVREAVAPPPPPTVLEPVAPPPPVPSWEREEPVAPLEFAPIDPPAIVPPEPPAAIFTPPAPVVAPPPQPVADVVSMLAEIKRDVEQLRQNREVVAAQPEALRAPPVVVPPPAPVEVPAPEIADIAVEARPVKKAQPQIKQKKGKKRKTRAQDEWGMFDPEKCGFAAIIQKLDEISRQSDEVS